MTNIVLRFAVASLGIAGFAASCESGKCPTKIAIVVEAGKACPSAEAAETKFQETNGDSIVDGLGDTMLLVPGTMCWYLAVFPNRVCTEYPTREEYVHSLRAAKEHPSDGHVISCDADQFLYGWWFPVDATTPEEAAGATPPECPASLDPSMLPVPFREEDIMELTDSDVFPGQVVCWYDVHNPCGGGCGGPGQNGSALSRVSRPSPEHV